MEDEYGPLTYTHLYSGTLKQGDRLYNSRTPRTVRVSRIVCLGVDRCLELETISAGKIVGLIGVECAVGDTLCTPGTNLFLEGMEVPAPVMTIAITLKSQADRDRLTKALQRFVKEDPTSQVSTDPESHKILLSGMGELDPNQPSPIRIFELNRCILLDVYLVRFSMRGE